MHHLKSRATRRGHKAKAAFSDDESVQRGQQCKHYIRPGHISKDTPDRSGLDMHFWSAAERVTVEWLKEQVKRGKKGAEAPPIPTHLG